MPTRLAYKLFLSKVEISFVCNIFLDATGSSKVDLFAVRNDAIEDGSRA